VAMTTVSTLLAVAATPLLTKLLVGQLVPVSVGALLLSTLQVCSAQRARGQFATFGVLALTLGLLMRAVMPPEGCVPTCARFARV